MPPGTYLPSWPTKNQYNPRRHGAGCAAVADDEQPVDAEEGHRCEAEEDGDNEPDGVGRLDRIGDRVAIAHDPDRDECQPGDTDGDAEQVDEARPGHSIGVARTIVQGSGAAVWTTSNWVATSLANPRLVQWLMWPGVLPSSRQ